MKFFTAQQVSEMMQVDLETIYAFIRNRELRAIQVAIKTSAKLPRYRITEADLNQFLESRTIAPVEQTPKSKPGRNLWHHAESSFSFGR